MGFPRVPQVDDLALSAEGFLPAPVSGHDLAVQDHVRRAPGQGALQCLPQSRCLRRQYGGDFVEVPVRRGLRQPEAGRRLKRDGIDGSGIATLMADAGLTNDAFYAHFASKEDLVATAVADRRHVVSVRRSGAGGIFRALRTRRMVDALTRWPSLSSSPWILLYPQP